MKTEAFDEVNNFLASTRASEDPIAIGRQFDACLRRHGLGDFCLDIVDGEIDDPSKISGLWNCPTGWVERYFRCGYVYVDPLIAVGRRQRRLFNWFELVARYELAEPAWRMLRDAAAFGMGIGATIPIHGPDGRYAIVSIAADQEADPTADAIRIHAPLLDMLSYSLYDRTAHLIHGRQLHLDQPCEPATPARDAGFDLAADPVVPFLSRVELDCLAWITCGLTVWDVSERIGASAAYTRRLLAGAEHRLAASSPTHAMVRALDLGMLRP
ncbi:MAG: autoinducer binding domain-containing protein [Alphaproteobacteria bacterium]